MSEIIDKIRQLAQRYGALSLPLRLLLGAFVSLLAGGGVGVLAEYAAYNYAYHYGVRPPLEGIPYLRLAMTGITVAALLAAAISFALVYAGALILLFAVNDFIRKLRFSFDLTRKFPVIRHLMPQQSEHPDILVQRFRDAPFHRVLLVAIAGGITFGVCVLLLARLEGDQVNTAGWVSAGAAAYFTIGLLLVWNRQIAFWLAVIALILALVGAPFVLFNVTVYGHILRALGYGGGLPVTVVLITEGAQPEEKINAALLLRTSSALILFDSKHQRMREVQLSRIQYIEHTANRSLTEPTTLP